MCIDLDGAGFLMERVVARVAVDKQRGLNTDSARPPAFRLPGGLCPVRWGILPINEGELDPLQSFEDFAQGSVPETRRLKLLPLDVKVLA